MTSKVADGPVDRTVPWRQPAESARIVAVAFQFLTRLPVPQIPVVDGDLRRATAAFPLVGLVVGAAVVAVRAAGEPLLGVVPATILAVAAAVAVTGAFHEDGLADTFDGLWGGWTPERRVEIMRDSRLGTYGAAALLFAISLQVSLLAALDLTTFARAVVAGHVLGRASVLVAVRWLPPYHDRGSGAQVADPLGPVGSTVAAVTTGAVLAVSFGIWAPVPVLAGLLALAALRRAARRRIGGLTGDILGAGQQLVLLTTLASAVALADHLA
ncbi:adenosylcobinamide-GDP ribazoletransferase [Nitriliruptor alkaliphilus]|uniref:adenosylcobinamide-GDP ribazoletransferase n=1 Tax=Nitriliruptor alkaliphilus TaxID=427918 RepID=UPI0006977F14|nr:adenosylcobinamide-GDP ribazoletransferase [Nitriliruptor alkaliphilus]